MRCRSRVHHLRLSDPELDFWIDVRATVANGRWLAVADLADTPELGLGKGPARPSRRRFRRSERRLPPGSRRARWLTAPAGGRTPRGLKGLSRNNAAHSAGSVGRGRRACSSRLELVRFEMARLHVGATDRDAGQGRCSSQARSRRGGPSGRQPGKPVSEPPILPSPTRPMVDGSLRLDRRHARQSCVGELRNVERQARPAWSRARSKAAPLPTL